MQTTTTGAIHTAVLSREASAAGARVAGAATRAAATSAAAISAAAIRGAADPAANLAAANLAADNPAPAVASLARAAANHPRDVAAPADEAAAVGFAACDTACGPEAEQGDAWQAAVMQGDDALERPSSRASSAGEARLVRGPGLGREDGSATLAIATSSKAVAGLRTRAERDGFDGLAAAELLRLLCTDLEPGQAERLLAARDLAHWSRASVQQIAVEAGLRTSAAVSLGAAFALGRLVEGEALPERARLNSPGLVHRLMAPRLRGLSVETLHVLLLDGKHRLRRVVRVSEGTLTSAMVHPREVYAPALREGAAALIAVHNHPSGDPEPSEDDVRVTRRLIDTGILVGVPLLDHVVVAGNGWVSLRERLRWES